MAYPQFPMPTISLGDPDHVPWSNQVSDKLDTYVDLKSDYQAVGDGVADDTTKFNNALSAASGRGLIVPPGNYKVTSELVVPSNCSVMGSGSMSKITGSGAINTVRLNIGTSNVNIRDLYIENLSAGSSGIRASTSTNVNITGCEVRAAEGINLVTTCSDCAVINNYVHDCTAQGIVVSNGPSRIRIIGNTVRAIGSTNLHQGIYCQALNSVVSGNTISDVYGFGINYYGEQAPDPSRSVIANNSIYNCGLGASGARGGITVGGNPVLFADFSITGNVCVGNGRTGIRLENLNRATVTGNVCVDNDEDGITIYSLLAGSRYINITGNQITRNQWQGIYLEQSAGTVALTITGNSIMENNLAATGRSGVRLLLTGGTLKSCVITGNTILDHGAGEGVYSSGAADNCVVVGNDLRGNSNPAGFVLAGAGNITGNNKT